MKKNVDQSPVEELKQMSERKSFSIRPGFVFILTIIFSILFIAAGWYFNQVAPFHSDQINSYRANVNLITHFEEDEFELGENQIIKNKEIHFLAEIKSGDLKGELVSATQYIDGMSAVNPVEVSSGSRVLLTPVSDMFESDAEFVFVEYDRSRTLIMLLALFFIALIIFGRMKGFRTILSLVITFMALFFVFIPAILNERNIYLTTLVTCSFIVLVTLLIINGANIKSFCAMIGNIGGLLIAGLLALIVNRAAIITGMIGEETVYLLYVENAPKLDLAAIVWSGMVIGALGAVMDVAMSVASSMHEISGHMERKDNISLLRAGLRVGSDVLGTMTNTLILAYIGSSLTLVLVLVVYQPSLMLMLNSEMIAVEIIQSLIGSLGILAAIPITSFVAAKMYSSKLSISH